MRRSIPGPALFLLGVLAVYPVSAQQEERWTEVPYVPTPQVTVDEMLRLAGVGPKDFVLDLGSGDGRIVITAARKFGARGLGVDLDFNLVIQSEESARQAGVEERARFLQQDLFQTDLGQATVITTYLLPSVMLKLRTRLLGLKPGTRIVSHDFDMDDWRPDRKTTIRKNVFFWIVPARVAGRWQARLPLPPIERLLELSLTQRFQDVSAHARLNGVPTQVWDTKLEGDRLSFAIVDSADRDNEATLYFDGRVSGDVMEGDLARGVGNARGTLKWQARRVLR
ncbi:MAG: class I SAM-dependent methyltransferase [Betaproteobacteria bacterium]|nr:class I SAM-dependent methyltransferase [Betaproteobacteria bacterium]